ncbi:hypothetical protein [Tautonia plasticadhaerens]|nr:hypothetical protein [Tautonia plasticadhaerens]
MPGMQESSDLMAVVPAVTAVPPSSLAGPDSVNILFPVFEPAGGVESGPKAAPVGILFPVLEPVGDANPCFSMAVQAASG